MTDRMIIGFAGYARCGKTTAAGLAEAVASELYPQIAVHRMSMAGPIRDALGVIGVTKEGAPSMYRDGAQALGAIARKYDMDWWVKQAEARLPGASEAAGADASPSLVVFDDIRYPNEVRMIQNRGGKVAFIDAAGRLDITQPLYGHESEHMAAHWMDGQFDGLQADAWIENNEDEASYDLKIRSWVGDILACQDK